MARPGYIPPHLRWKQKASGIPLDQAAASTDGAASTPQRHADNHERQNASAWKQSVITAPSTLPQSQPPVFKDNYERHNASAWDQTIVMSPTAVPQLRASITTPISCSSRSSESDLIGMSPTGCVTTGCGQHHYHHHHHHQHQEEQKVSLLDGPEDELVYQDRPPEDRGDSGNSTDSTSVEADCIGDGSTDNGSVFNAESSLTGSDDGSHYAKGYGDDVGWTPKVLTSIPGGIDIGFDPPPPPHGIVIKQGVNSVYFASHFRGCTFDGLVVFANCIISEAVFNGCHFRGTCIFTNVVFKDLWASDCVFMDSSHTNRTFRAGRHIGEKYIGDRARDNTSELPLAMTDTTWKDGQNWTRPLTSIPVPAPFPATVTAPNPTSAATHAQASALPMNNPAVFSRHKASRSSRLMPSEGSSRLAPSVIPVEAGITFDRRPSHGFSMKLGDGGLCQRATFNNCQYKGIRFVDCIMFNVAFVNCKFSDVTLTNCVFINTQFVDCAMMGNSFTDYRYHGAELVGCTYDATDHPCGHRTPKELKKKHWAHENMTRLTSRRDERFKTVGEVQKLRRDQLSRTAALYKPTVFVSKSFD